MSNSQLAEKASLAYDLVIADMSLTMPEADAIINLTNEIAYFYTSTIPEVKDQFFIALYQTFWATAVLQIESLNALPYNSNFLIDTTLTQLATNISGLIDGVYAEHYGYQLHKYAPYETGLMNVGCTMKETSNNSNIVEIEFNCCAYKKSTNQISGSPGFNVEKLMSADVQNIRDLNDDPVEINPGVVFALDEYKKVSNDSPIDGVGESVLTETYSSALVETTMEVIKNIFTSNSIDASKIQLENEVNSQVDSLLANLNGVKIWVRLEGSTTDNENIFKFYKNIACDSTDELSLSNSDYLGVGPDTNLSNGSDAQLFAEWLCHHQNNLDRINSVATQGAGAVVDKTFMERVLDSMGSVDANNDPLVDTVLDMGSSEAVPNDCMRLSLRVKAHVNNVQNEIWHTTGNTQATATENTRTEFGAFLQLTKFGEWADPVLRQDIPMIEPYWEHVIGTIL